ncbi:MAG: putative methyltransferase YcgJ [Pseudomonadota bacterium]|jgi:ArsR family transcriptional regulator
MAALNEPTRARLLRVIEQHELSVGEISQVLQLPQSTTSRHIKVLSEGEWLASRRDGTSRLYRLAKDLFPQSQIRLWSFLKDNLGPGAQAQQDDARLHRVLFDRQSKGQEFFATSAGNWDKIRHELFGSEFELGLLPALLPEESVVCDLGCGTGRIAELLAPFASRVIGIDASAAMIEAAKTRLASHLATGNGYGGTVELHQAELKSVPLASASVDVALLVLVLHYVSDPQGVLCEVARVLKPGGKLVLLDMQPHTREEYRAQMGHLWQGFDAGVLKSWLTTAGFSTSRYAALPPDPMAKGPPLFVSSAHTANPHDRGKRYLLLNGN